MRTRGTYIVTFSSGHEAIRLSERTRSDQGTLAVARLARRELRDRDPIMIFDDGGWQLGRLSAYGDGRRLLPCPVIVLEGSHRVVALESNVRARTLLRTGFTPFPSPVQSAPLKAGQP